MDVKGMNTINTIHTGSRIRSYLYLLYIDVTLLHFDVLFIPHKVRWIFCNWWICYGSYHLLGKARWSQVVFPRNQWGVALTNR